MTPPPVEGRVHVIVQTDGTLEDMFESNDVTLVDYCSENEKEYLVGSLNGTIPEGDDISSRGESDESYDDDENIEPNCQEDERLNEKESDECTHNNMEDQEWFDNDENLTKNLARIIYDEAKNHAILRIEEESLCQSDPER